MPKRKQTRWRTSKLLLFLRFLFLWFLLRLYILFILLLRRIKLLSIPTRLIPFLMLVPSLWINPCLFIAWWKLALIDLISLLIAHQRFFLNFCRGGVEVYLFGLRKGALHHFEGRGGALKVVLMGDEPLVALLCKNFEGFHVVDPVPFNKLLDVLPHVIRVGQAFKNWSNLLKLFIFLIFKPWSDWNGIWVVKSVAIWIVVHNDNIF